MSAEYTRQRNQKIAFIVLSMISVIALSIFDPMPVEDDDIDTRSGTILNTSAIGGRSKSLAVTQQANVARSFYPLSLPTNASFFLVNTWRSKNVSVNFNGVSHYKDWIANGGFTSGLTPWVFKRSTSFFTNTTSTGNATISISTSSTFAKGAYGYFEENVTVPEPLTTNKLASISLDYYFFDNGKDPSANMSLILSVTIGSVEKNISVQLTDIVYTSWTKLTLTYNPQTTGQVLPGQMTIRAGIYTYNTPCTSSNKAQRLSIDNVRFNIWTMMNQSNSLTIRDNEFNQNYSYQNITTGTGKAFIGVERSRGTSSDVIFTIFKNSLVTEDVEAYNVTVTSFVERQFNSTISGVPGSQYNAGGSSVNWTTYLNFVTPSSYISERAIVGKPSDWNFTTITDGYGLDRVAACSGTGIGSNATVIPKTILYDGLWKLEARSTNYISSGAVQVWSGSVFENRTSIYVGEVFRVNIGLAGSLNLAGSLMDCRIFYPNNSIYYENNSYTPASPTVVFGSLTMIAIKPVGTYLVQVNWTNDLDTSKKDKVGLLDLEFQVIHHANITAINSYFQRTPGEPLLVKVKVMDIDASVLISSATVLFNTTYGLSGNMSYFGSGVYAAEVDTSSLPLGDHYFSFNASKDGYLDCLGNNLVHLRIVSESLKLEVPRDTKSVLANSFAVYRFNLTGSISQMFIQDANILTNWFKNYTVTDHDNGSYTLNLSTYEATTLSTPETFTISIYASKSNYASTSDVVIMTVYPINATLRMNSTYVEIHAGEQFDLDANYTVDANGSLIAGATLTVTWPSAYQIQAAGSQYVITFNTTSLNIGTYTGILRVTRPGFETRIESFFVVVEPVKTQLVIINPEPIEFVKGTVGNLTSRFLANGVDFLNGNLTLLGDLTGTFQRAGPTYYFTINTSLYAKGTYFVQVYAQGLNVESNIKDLIISIVPIHAEGVLNATYLEAYFGGKVQLEANYTVLANGNPIPGASITVTWFSNYSVSALSDRYLITLDTWNLTLGTFTGVVKMEHPSYDVVFENYLVIVRPVKTMFLVDNTAPYQFIKGSIANISCRYISGSSPLLNASLSISGDLSGNFMWNGSRYVFSFNTGILSSKTYIAQILATKANAESAVKDFIFSIVPIHADGVLNDSFLEAFLGDKIQLEANYTVLANGNPIPGASITVTWPSDYTFSWSTDRYLITLDTWNLTLGTFTGVVRMEHPNYESKLENFQVLVRPIKTTLQLDSLSPEFIKGDIANISCRYLAGGSPLLNASLSLSGDLSGNLTWNGSRYVFSFDTSTNTSKSYYAQIIAMKANAETQIDDFIFRIVSLLLEINITTDISMTYQDGQVNEIIFWIVDTNHNITNCTDFVVEFTVNSITRQVLPEPGGMYKISVNQLNLVPSNTPYLLHITLDNPYGTNVTSTITIVYTPQNGDNGLIITIIISTIAAIGVVSALVYRRGHQLTRFQKEIKAAKDGLVKKGKMGKYVELSRDDAIYHLLSERLPVTKGLANGRRDTAAIDKDGISKDGLKG